MPSGHTPQAVAKAHVRGYNDRIFVWRDHKEVRHADSENGPWHGPLRPGERRFYGEAKFYLQLVKFTWKKRLRTWSKFKRLEPTVLTGLVDPRQEDPLEQTHVLTNHHITVFDGIEKSWSNRRAQLRQIIHRHS